MSHKPKIFRVALPVPVRKCFDYLLDDKTFNKNKIKPGTRVKVPFGKKQPVGIIVEVKDKSELKKDKLKSIIEIIDRTPVISGHHLQLLIWAAEYYHHPIGEVIFSSLPALLRKGHSDTYKNEFIYLVDSSSVENLTAGLKNAPKQLAVLKLLVNHPLGLTAEQLNSIFSGWRIPLKSLIEKNRVIKKPVQDGLNIRSDTKQKPLLNSDQNKAFKKIISKPDEFNTLLLNGVTGSGKTEVYLACIESVITSGKQALVLVPEIGLTPQFIDRFRKHFDTRISVLHSSLSDRERLNTWIGARDGRNKIILGTRSAIWVPMLKPGIIVIDEEHDLSYKQQEGFRYSARDIAIVRGQRDKIPVVLGSATPSLESLHNANIKRYIELKLPERTGSAKLPSIHILDMRGEKTSSAFSRRLLDEISNHIKKNQQVLLFQNRRGYSPVMMCHDCGQIKICQRCDVPMTYHKQNRKLRCHHCDHQENFTCLCANCAGENIIQVGHGTERLYETLTTLFAEASILRIDRDTTRRKSAMQNMLDQITSGKANIFIGTQMLAKGHDFPKLTLVGIIDADAGLFNPDYRASERMAQLITQVSGRAGRASDQGSVIIQTHHPQHPLLDALCNQGYEGFARLVLSERQEADLPPFSYQALIRAESNKLTDIEKFLRNARHSLLQYKHAEIFGPMISPIEKIAGRYRMQLLIQSKNRSGIKNILDCTIVQLESDKLSRKVRWSIDIDPQDLS